MEMGCHVYGPSGDMWKVCPFQTLSHPFRSVGGLAVMGVEVGGYGVRRETEQRNFPFRVVEGSQA